MAGAIIKPGDAEFTALKRAMEEQALIDPQTKSIEFTTFPMKQGVCEYALVELTPTTSKLVFHFKGVSKEFMVRLSSFFMSEVCGKIITEEERQAGTVISAGENPIYRNNWDVEILHINRFMARPKMNLIVRQLKETVGL